MGRLIQQSGCRFLLVGISSKSVCVNILLTSAYHNFIEFTSKSQFYILHAGTSLRLGLFQQCQRCISGRFSRSFCHYTRLGCLESFISYAAYRPLDFMGCTFNPRMTSWWPTRDYPKNWCFLTPSYQIPTKIHRWHTRHLPYAHISKLDMYYTWKIGFTWVYVAVKAKQQTKSLPLSVSEHVLPHLKPRPFHMILIFYRAAQGLDTLSQAAAMNSQNFQNEGTHCHQRAELPADAPAALEPAALAMSHCKQDLEHR